MRKELAGGIPDPLGQTRIFACLGDKEPTIEALERGIPEGPFRIGREVEHPEFAALRGDPRIKAIRKKARLPE
jgi:hypothetical protein